MTLRQYPFKAGVSRENTRYTAEGQWWDMDKTRFRAGTPEKIGGWVKQTIQPFLGVCRLLFAWIDLRNANLLAIGTHLRLYGERGGDIFDITPVTQVYNSTSSPSAVNCIQTTALSNVVRVNVAGYDSTVGSQIIISGATSFNGIPADELNGEHTVTNTTSTLFFEFEVTTPANASGTGGGSDIRVEILLVNGVEYQSFGTGWGASFWGRNTWGSAADTAVSTGEQLRLWSFDSFGENLLACPRGNQIFYWLPSNGFSSVNRAFPLSFLPGASDTPLFCNVVLSTDERYVVAFGTNAIGETTQDPLLIRWSDQEDPANWTPTPTNTAGDIRIGVGSLIIGAQQTRQEILIWTDTSLHALQYLGAPYVFNLQTLSTNTTLISPNAAITVNNVTYWMGVDKFYAYSGRVETLPCSLRRYVFNDINPYQSFQVQAGLNEYFGEIYWFYCSAGSNRVNKYVVFNYNENIWYFGTLDRSAWLQANSRHDVYGASYDGYVYQQETGADDGSTNPPSPITAYIESADFDIDEGEKFSFIKRIIPDITFDGSTSRTPSVTYTLKVKNYPGATYDQTASNTATAVSGTVDQYTTQLWTRVRGRQAVLRVESSGLGVQWQIGTTRLDLRPDGRR